MSDYDPFNLEAQDQVAIDRKDDAKLAEDQEIEDFRWLMSGPRGRRIVWNLLEKTGVFRSTFVPGDPHAGAFAEGQRNIGCFLMDQIHRHCTDQYVQMLKERNTDV
jgi:hypothetical protein